MTLINQNISLFSVQVSVIIPTYNEEKAMARTIKAVCEHSYHESLEIIVSDGCSTDDTVDIARSLGAKVVKGVKLGRAAQMNAGAKQASGELFYFLHADSIPPKGFIASILEAYKKDYPAGCFRLAFDHSNPFLNLFAWFTRFDIDAFRFGDQSLFITKELFWKLEGFREDHIVMEDQDIVRRIKRTHSFALVPDAVITSARKYLETGVLKLQLIFTIIFCLYYLGVNQKTLKHLYKDLLSKK